MKWQRTGYEKHNKHKPNKKTDYVKQTKRRLLCGVRCPYKQKKRDLIVIIE